MDWRSHVLIGIVLSLPVMIYLQVELPMLILLSLFAGFSALLPDVDHKMSKIRWLADRAFVLFAVIYSYSNCMGCSVGEVIKDSLVLIGIYFLILTFLSPRHRGITHSLLFVVLYGAVLFLLFDGYLALAGLIGYLSHLVADKEIKIW